VGRQSVDLVGAFVEAARSPGDVIGLYRPLRRLARGGLSLYRELEELSHTYPRDETPRILDWLAA
jgi:hypothetical protein